MSLIYTKGEGGSKGWLFLGPNLGVITICLFLLLNKTKQQLLKANKIIFIDVIFINEFWKAKMATSMASKFFLT
ncbi:MAG: hypothetical protein DRJ11_09205 [Candidatus Aminicenantes bacterium]|nr:MAG: hypothetical protein DRJ11_09205 [Candidatus Aminicenantes bacterium]